MYETDLTKQNKKVRPFIYSYDTESSTKEYFDQFRSTGIELDTSKISEKNIQFGYMLEFINALQEQDVIQYESLKVIDENTEQRHEHYLKNGSPDKRNISLWVYYNEELVEYSNGLKVSNDPYLPKLFVTKLNTNSTSSCVQYVKLTLERINQNVQHYLKRKLQEDKEKSVIENHCFQIEDMETLHIHQKRVPFTTSYKGIAKGTLLI